MKIRTNLHTHNIYTNNGNSPQKTQHVLNVNNHQSFKIGFGSAYVMPKSLKASLVIQKMLAKLVGQETNVKYYELGLLEGIQEGIDVFKGLSLKQIAFLCDDLHSVMTKRGCFSHCAYCYPGAKTPVKQTENTINSLLYEDLKAFTEGLHTLKQRSGINFIHNNSKKPYQTLVFDADNIDIAVKDLNGNIHEYPELNKLLYDATGTGGVFDTSGWNILSEMYQKRAERIVDYYAKPEHMKELYQFNISINPFHSTLVKVNELKEKGNLEIAAKIYDKHIEKTANALFTCIPLCKSEKFNTINRAFSYEVPNMHGYYFTDEMQILNDVFEKLCRMCKQDLKTNQKYIKTNSQLNDVLYNFADRLQQKGEVVNLNDIRIDTELIAAPQLEKFVRSKNPQMSDFEFCKLFKDVLKDNESFEMMKHYKRYGSANMHYFKMIDSNGKVYLTDAYRVIPTDISLNFINKDKKTEPFSTLVEDFVLTKKMI